MSGAELRSKFQIYVPDVLCELALTEKEGFTYLNPHHFELDTIQRVLWNHPSRNLYKKLRNANDLDIQFYIWNDLLITTDFLLRNPPCVEELTQSLCLEQAKWDHHQRVWVPMVLDIEIKEDCIEITDASVVDTGTLINAGIHVIGTIQQTWTKNELLEKYPDYKEVYALSESQ